MAFEQVKVTVSPHAAAELTRVKEAMEAGAGRRVPYAEVIERLCVLYDIAHAVNGTEAGQ